MAPTYGSTRVDAGNGSAHTLFGSPSRARRVLARARRAKANAIASATASTQNGAQCPATALVHGHMPVARPCVRGIATVTAAARHSRSRAARGIGRASRRGSVGQYVLIRGVGGSLKNKK